MKTLAYLWLAFVLLGCANGTTSTLENPPKMLVVGDSMMAWNRILGQSTPDVLENITDFEVTNRSVIAAPLTAAVLDVRSQMTGRDWDWILVNGGANDLLFGCGCNACQDKLNGMMSEDGRSGDLADFLTTLRGTGAQVMMVGYHRPKKLNSPYKQCRDELDELDRRVSQFVADKDGIHFANLQDVFPVGDASYYTFDHTHPSRKGSRAMAERLKQELDALQ